MSEGVFLEPRNANTNALLRSGPSTAFGTAGLSVTAKPGCLYQFNAINTGATAYYLQIHDKATAPVASDVPIWEMRLAASGDLPTSFQLAGLYFANGIAFAISTTPRLLTLAAANDCVVYTRHTTAG
jgi:hypothetical protein